MCPHRRLRRAQEIEPVDDQLAFYMAVCAVLLDRAGGYVLFTNDEIKKMNSQRPAIARGFPAEGGMRLRNLTGAPLVVDGVSPDGLLIVVDAPEAARRA
jgi:hypothetical protein